MSGERDFRVADGVCRVPLSIVNAYFLQATGGTGRDWVLVDAGLSFSESAIVAEARAVFGPDARPAAVVLTHGHFDHVGCLESLVRRWDVPVYAHRLEAPYLSGRADYPPPDPAVGGGMMALLSPLYSRRGLNLGDRLHLLPADGSVPHLPGWRWVHTPGHTAGHVALFRDADRVLVAGDAFVTTRQESMLAALFKPPAIHGPPAYFTTDWVQAAASVRELANLRPEVAATGHGVPMRGEEMRKQLDRLAEEFEREAVPSVGRYVHTPARADANGVYSVPPPVFPVAYAGLAVAAGAIVGAVSASGRSRPTHF